MKKRILLLITIITLSLPNMTIAQDNEPVVKDSSATESDSLIEALRSQVQELKLQGILMQEQLEKTGLSAREDSIRKAKKMARIDSLRKILPGSPVVVEGDTLFKIYNRKGGILPGQRSKTISDLIVKEGMKVTLFTDSIYVYDGDYTADIMAGDQVIMSVTDNDALWHNTSRLKLAADYRTVIETKIKELHEVYGLRQKIKGAAYVAGIIVALIIMISLTNWLFRKLRFRLTRILMRRAKPLAIKDYEVLNVHRMGVFLMGVYTTVKWLIILFLLLICVPLIFSAFPETKSLTYTIIGYIWNPFKGILASIVGYLPNFFQIVVIVLCFRYLVKGVHYLTNEIASGRMKLNGFYADWAHPTYYIIRLLLYSFMFVMIWPLLPNSDSEIFQGVSVFIGIMVSLGSSSIIGNVMAGMVMTYMRPFRVGDFIKYGDTEGFVIEKTVLVTRIKTRKNNVITIPNSSLMGSQTTNYTFSAQNYGIIVHTSVTIGYDMPWEQIKGLLLEAAKKTNGLKQKPEPFVLVKSLDDYYVEYELNAYTTAYERLPIIYSELHHHILDTFHSNGVEIMSPHIYAHRNDLELQIPKKDQK